MFCEKCGDKVELNETYCNKCGNFLGNRQPMAQQQDQTEATILQQAQTEGTMVQQQAKKQASILQEQTETEAAILQQEPVLIPLTETQALSFQNSIIQQSQQQAVQSQPEEVVIQPIVQQQEIVQPPVQLQQEVVQQPVQPTVQQPPVIQPPVQQPIQSQQQFTENNNISNNSNMFGNNVRSFNQQMMNINYNQQPSTNNNQLNIKYNQQTTQQPGKRRKTKSVAIGFVLGAVVFGIIAFVILTTFQDTVYLSDDTYKDGTEEKTGKSSKTKTVIIYDNKYSGMNISNETDANNLIVKDSVDQKGTCPKEIIAIENNIIKNYGITAVNLCEMEPAFAKEVGNVFKIIYEEYPDAKGYLTNLTLVNAPISSGYIAAFQPIFTFATSASDSTYPWVLKTQIYLNTSYFLNKPRLQTSVESGSATGHFPPNATIYSPVAHEMGHYLSFLAMMNNYKVDSILLINDQDTDLLYQLIDDFGKGTFSLEMITEAYNRFKKDVGTTLSIDDWRATISSYAVAKDNSGNYIYDETIAESFHDVYLNKDKAAQASKYVVAVLKEKLKKGA